MIQVFMIFCFLNSNNITFFKKIYKKSYKFFFISHYPFLRFIYFVKCLRKKLTLSGRFTDITVKVFGWGLGVRRAQRKKNISWRKIISLSEKNSLAKNNFPQRKKFLFAKNNFLGEKIISLSEKQKILNCVFLNSYPYFSKFLVIFLNTWFICFFL